MAVALVSGYSRPRDIVTWLDNIVLPTPKTSLKRKYSLIEMHGDTTPRRMSQRFTENQLGPEPAFDIAEKELDVGHTLPLSIPLAIANAPRLPHDASQSDTGLSTTVSSPTRSTGNSAASRKRRRDGSPAKSLAMLKRAAYGVEQRLMGRVGDLPEPLRALTKTLKGISLGRGLITPQQAEHLLPHLVDEEEDAGRVVSPMRLEMGETTDLPFAQRIIDQVADNISLARSEAAWNCNVHAPLLDEAWRKSTHKNGLRWENITTASIEPRGLLPILNSFDAVFSKRVDFAITLRLGRETERHLARSGVTALTQSTYEPLRYSPIAVSFETKLQGENWADANLQLNTWALAQVTKLKELLAEAGRSSVGIPPLPLVVVQGNEWKFLYMEVGLDQAWLWTSVALGDVGCVRGVFQVVAALQRLMEWSQTVYRPWFEQNILIPILSTVTTEALF